MVKSGAADEDGEEDGVKVVDSKTTITVVLMKMIIELIFWGKLLYFRTLLTSP